MRHADPRRSPHALAGAAALAVVAACASPTNGANDGEDRRLPIVATDQPSVPATAPDIRGTITLVQPGDSVPAASSGGDPNAPVSCPPSCAPAGARLRAVLIEEIPGPLTTGGAKSYATVPSTARLLRRVGERVVVLGFDGLLRGQRVEAWFTGPVAESYPSRATAHTILVLEP